MKKTLLTTVIVALTAACSSNTVNVRPGAPAPKAGVDKFIVMPVDIHGLKGDSMAQGAALMGGFIAAFGDTAVPLQPIKPALEAAGLGNISWELAEGMHHLVSTHKVYDFNEDGGFHGGSSKLPLIVEGTAKLVELAAEQLELGFSPKYVVVAHIDSASSSMPKTIGYRVIAGMYNVEAKKIDRVVWWEKSTADDEAAILAEMATVGSDAHKFLFDGGES